MASDLDPDICYRALQTRDPRFDGRFYTAVVTTGIYCRPVCPAKPPKRENCLFLPSAAAARRLGFRACLRCRPEAAEGSPAWNGTGATVARALQLIAEGSLEEDDVPQLAARLGIGARHLNRLFTEHLGASPLTLAVAQRALFARKLLTETRLSVTEVVFASGFRSVRRFNHVMQATFGAPPRALRKREGAAIAAGDGVRLKMPFKRPYDWASLHAFLAARAIPGIEATTAGSYARTFAVSGASGIVLVHPGDDQDHLFATIRIDRVSALHRVVAALRRLFDLDADSAVIDAHLGSDPLLAPFIARRPGLRVPGAIDPFELTVRAILGQLVSVKAARTLAGRLVAAHGAPLEGTPAHGEPSRLFPTPMALANADLTAIGLPKARARAISALAQAVLAEPNLLTPHGALGERIARLAELDGIGPWTAQYIAMRALREPDAFPAGDLGLARALAGRTARPDPREVLARAESWRPWRAYAAMHLWAADSTASTKGPVS